MRGEFFFFQGVDLHMLDKLRVQEGEASKLILVKIHHEQLVGGGQVHALAGELPVEVGNILPVALEMEIGIIEDGENFTLQLVYFAYGLSSSKLN